MSNEIKVSFVTSDRVMTKIKDIAYDRGLSITEVIRHALALEVFFHDEFTAESRVIIERPGGKRRLLTNFVEDREIA